MTTLSQAFASLPQAERQAPAAGDATRGVVYRLRRSRSIASMLPSFFLSGVITVVMTAVMHLMWSGWRAGFFGAWMESWLISWPIAFPVAYLVGPALTRLAARISAPARQQARLPGLAFGDIAAASARVTASNGLTVLRNLKPAHDFSAV